MIGTAFSDGMALAAMVHDDRAGAACLAGMTPGLARALAERLEALGSLSREARHREVRALVDARTQVPEDADAPPRARAILATDVPREVGARWSRSAPKVRRGFRVTRGLKDTLRRLASRGARDTRADEVIAARASELEPERFALLRRWARALGGEEEERALGALLLGMQGDLAGDPWSRRLRAIGRELAHVEEAPWRE